MKLDMQGTDKVSESDIEEKIGTAPSPRFLGLFPGVVFDYELFDPYVLQKDLERIERYYRARGYYDAHARGARVEHRSDNRVAVTIEVDEGLPVQVATIEVHGLESVPRRDADAAVRAMRSRLRNGMLFDESAFAAAEDALKHALTDRGYAFAKTKRDAFVDLVSRAAFVRYDVEPDRIAILGPVSVEGLGPLVEGPVRRALNLHPGERFSTRELESAQQATLDLGVFSAVEISPDLPDPPPEPRVVPVRVRVQPVRLRNVTLGVGAELDVIRTDVHLRAGWESRNFLGGMRRLRIDFRPGIVLYPTRLPELPAPDRVLPEERLRAEFHQPGFIEARTNGVLRGEFNVYPVLLTPQVDPNAPVLGYQEALGSAGLDRTLWKLYANLSYNLQANFPFAYFGELDPGLRNVVISYVDLRTDFDFRDDRIHPHAGFLLGNDLQVAGGLFGGQTRDVRVQPEVRAYVPLPKRVTLAARTSVGFLFPMNYGSLVEQAGDVATPPTTNREAWARDVQLVFFRAFFSGGPSSNRGYPLRGDGPHGPVPFYNPGIAAEQLARSCAPGDPAYDESRCALPLGGQSLWEASLELRIPVSGPLSAALFCDASDVSPRRLSIRLARPHLSCGAGARYDTPVGPVRLDIGYRLPGLQRLDGSDERTDGNPGEIFGLPMAVAFGIGEAF